MSYYRVHEGREREREREGFGNGKVTVPWGPMILVENKRQETSLVKERYMYVDIHYKVD